MPPLYKIHDQLNLIRLLQWQVTARLRCSFKAHHPERLTHGKLTAHCHIGATWHKIGDAVGTVRAGHPLPKDHDLAERLGFHDLDNLDHLGAAASRFGGVGGYTHEPPPAKTAVGRLKQPLPDEPLAGLQWSLDHAAVAIVAPVA